MKISGRGESKYLTQNDVPTPMIQIVTNVTMDEFGGMNGQPKERKMVLHFNQCKPMVFNGINQRVMMDLFNHGAEIEDSNQIIGKSIEIYADPSIMFGANRVGGLRLRAPSGMNGNQNGSAPAGTWSYEQSCREAAAVGITKEELIAKLKAAGKGGWNPSCVQLVRDMIQDKQQEVPFDSDGMAPAPQQQGPNESIPF